MRNILVTGLCTLHWGRLQYGNVGNYYIVEPLFRLLHKYFPEYNIHTTFQMDDTFVKNEGIEVLPMELYYSWNEECDLPNAKKDAEVAALIADGRENVSTPFLDVIKKCEYIINVSGDMWGDNAEHVGKNRFYVDCLKMKACQLLRKKTVLYACTPGPFSDGSTSELAKEVFDNFSLVVVREKVSLLNIKKWGLATEHVVWAPCPSFLFEADEQYESEWIDYISEEHNNGRKVVGMTFGGFNMPEGPYDMWPREKTQYNNFLNLAEHIIKDLGMDILIFSHTNGFELPPNFQLINGRDYTILEYFYKLLNERLKDCSQNIKLISEPLLPKNLKSLIGRLDLLVTGRVHASVAATSQCVPTVFVEYDSNVIYSDKMTGFSEQLELQEYVCNPANLEEMVRVTDKCFENMDEIKAKLANMVPIIKEKSEHVFEKIRDI